MQKKNAGGFKICIFTFQIAEKFPLHNLPAA